MLDDLSSPAGIGCNPSFKPLILVLHLNETASPGFTHTGERQTAFLRLILAGGFQDLGVEHDRGRAVIIEDDNTLGDSDHVRCYAYAALFMGGKSIPQVLGDGEIQNRCRSGLLREKDGIFQDGLYESLHLCG